MDTKKPAIERDDAGADRDISQISARDFLTILDAEGLGAASLTLLPEKKKLELYQEPEWNRAIKVRDLVRSLKGEKKKVELELPFDPNIRVNPPYFQGYAAQQPYAAQPYAAQPYAARAAFGGAVGYPNPEDDTVFPYPIEIRKTQLDQRFNSVLTKLTQQVAQLSVVVQELKEKI